MRALQTDFFGDHNIGLFARASDKLCLVGGNLPRKKLDSIGKIINVEVLGAAVAGTELVGIFCAMNSSGLLLPKIAGEEEMKSIQKVAGTRGVAVSVLDSKFTALGNLVLCNDSGAAVSRLLSTRDKKIIEDCLDVEVGQFTIAGLNSVGSCGIATNRGCLLHRDASEDELDGIQGLLKVETDIGTGNFGSPFVGACAIANSSGIVAGESTTGPEMTRMMEALSLL